MPGVAKNFLQKLKNFFKKEEPIKFNAYSNTRVDVAESAACLAEQISKFDYLFKYADDKMTKLKSEALRAKELKLKEKSDMFLEKQKFTEAEKAISSRISELTKK